MISIESLFKKPYSSPGVLLFQLLLSSTVVGFTEPHSQWRSTALPVTASCVYFIAKTTSQHLRSRWSSLLGGISFAFFLQYIDIGLLSRFEFRGNGNLAPQPPIAPEKSSDTSNDVLVASQPNMSQSKPSKDQSVWKRFCFGWSTLWSFRHVNTIHEVRNVPPFSRQNPTYVPPRWSFVIQRAIGAATCYVVLDLLGSRPPPANPGEIFHPSLIPFFRRITEVTMEQLKLRALSIVGFAVTFYCIIQGYHSTMAALTVALGISKVENWRPIFGSMSDAYTVANFWGKVWHQSLRHMITSPAAFVASKLFKLPRDSQMYRYTTVLLAFINSASLHYIAGLSSGAPPDQLGVFQFFTTQAFGVLIELSARRLYRQSTIKSNSRDPPRITWRYLGYVWVMAFMTWSGPSWLYPSAAKSASGDDSFLPFSLVKVLRKQNTL